MWRGASIARHAKSGYDHVSPRHQAVGWHNRGEPLPFRRTKRLGGHMKQQLSRSIVVCLVAIGVPISGACRRREPAAPALATPSVSLSHARAPLGSPLDVTYKFVVASDAHFDQDYRVMMHV